ncbi:MAG TPA: MarR family transcriptional regulator [Gaiellaceae bacterium]|nr:MarR family transcriptional regulator [Gaiellaceae bacterium]
MKAALFTNLPIAAHLSVWLGGRALEERGIDPTGFLFLAHVADLEPVSPTRLAQLITMRRTTVRDGLQQLEERGALERVPSPTDRRSQLVRLTPQGRELYERGWRALEEAAAEIELELDAPLERYLEALDELSDALRALAHTPG